MAAGTDSGIKLLVVAHSVPVREGASLHVLPLQPRVLACQAQPCQQIMGRSQTLRPSPKLSAFGAERAHAAIAQANVPSERRVPKARASAKPQSMPCPVSTIWRRWSYTRFSWRRGVMPSGSSVIAWPTCVHCRVRPGSAHKGWHGEEACLRRCSGSVRPCSSTTCTGLPQPSCLRE